MVALLVASAIWGAWRGLVYELLAIANWLVAAALTGLLAPLVAEWVPFLAGNGLLAVSVRYVVVFVVFIFVGGFIASFVRRVISNSGLRPADRSLGAIFGLVRGVIVNIINDASDNTVIVFCNSHAQYSSPDEGFRLRAAPAGQRLIHRI